MRGSVLPGDHVIAVNGKVIEGLGQRHLRVPSVLFCRSRGNGQDTQVRRVRVPTTPLATRRLGGRWLRRARIR